MSSPGQKRGTCGHVMAVFDNHKKFARCRDKGVGDDPCVKKQECKICQALTPAQLKQLSTPTYQSRKECELKKLSSDSPASVTPLSWSQQTSVCWDGYTRNLMEVHLLARTRRQTLPLPPRLAVRRNPAASQDLMI